MYWLIGSLVIVVMMGVLAVADSMAMSIDPFLLDVAGTPNLFILLVMFAIMLMVIAQYNVPVDHFNNNAVSNSSSHSSSDRKTPFRIITYILVAIVATALIFGSVLQAIISQQQAKDAAIADPMRVKALVTVEGISDSVYDPSTENGYRQVVTISQISPLVAELTDQDLDNRADSGLTSHKNSLSKISTNDNGLGKNHNDTYRVLLSAYPKSYSKSSSNKPSNDEQLTGLNHLRPGDQRYMSLTLTPLSVSGQHADNPSGFDSYRWLRGRHIDGTATVLATGRTNITNTQLTTSKPSDSYLQRFRTYIDQGRWQLRQYFYEGWAGYSPQEQQAKAVTLSLLTGDRSLISRDIKDLYQLAGISHLLAISGTHILFLTIMLSGGVVLLLDRFCPLIYRSVPRWQVRWGVMVAAAFIYALFTGFDVPAARTAWMLLAVGLARLTLLPIGTIRVLFALAVLMAWYDPYVLWQAGYWLSFIAVALLLKYEDKSYQYAQAEATHKNRGKEFFKRIGLISKRLFKLQFWLFLTLLPITLLLFGKVSLWGLVINLFAIGLFGWVIVPLNLLAGLCYLISPTIADGVWSLVIAIVGALHKLIVALTSLPVLSKAWLYTPVNMAMILMVLLSLLPWLLPRGFISRWLTIPPLTLLMMTVYANQQSLATIPTLYILPTGDRYLSAALLQYPVANNDSNIENKNTSWLVLADHRSTTTRTLPSRLTADKLSAILAQQLGSLSVNKLDGIIVQSSAAGLTTTLTTDNKSTASSTDTSLLLPKTVAQLSEYLPISQYWQAGRSDRWSGVQRAYKEIRRSDGRSEMSAQGCEQGKTWKSATGDLSIQALTGWSQIDDASVWDCTVAIDTSLPIRVLTYNAADPLRSLPVTAQSIALNNPLTAQQTDSLPSRLILNADTHQRVWQMWSLLCPPEFLNNKRPNNKLSVDKTIFSHTTWLGHSDSHITTDVMTFQHINDIVTYDDKGLEAALPLYKKVDTAP
ncbi:ComEC/Rec2 family competence protein [Psychrobacter sp. B38]|uniref:ComEC/Rec2 family competence protein n=1 Tax=Psychrobacter sp. B38 TaxID=3143538 RepID=UPI00320EF55F